MENHEQPRSPGRQWIRGVDDLATKSPEVASSWHPHMNGSLTPELVASRSGKKVWWACPLGHEWVASVVNRANGTGCPVCAGKTIVAGYNDLATVNPGVAASWHPAKNGSLTPKTVSAGTERRVSWVCALGHEWEAAVASRARGSGCPVCAGKTILAGYNDLATVNPGVAAQWHPTKNGLLTTETVTLMSHKRAWWVCPRGHEWEAAVNDRSKGHGCPVCAGQLILAGYNDLATVNPELAASFHPTKNGLLTPEMVTLNSGQKAWWLCMFGHDWAAVVSNRANGHGCPVCANQIILVGFNDLVTTNPEVASSWHPTKNGSLTPELVALKSNKKVWWVCQLGHEWKTAVADRARGSGCPRCAKYGFDQTSPAVLYFLSHPELKSRKVGITVVGGKRLPGFVSEGWEVLSTFSSQDGSLILAVETSVLSWIRKDLGLPPHLGPQEMGRQQGWSETFSADGPSDAEVIERIKTTLTAFSLRRSEPFAL